MLDEDQLAACFDEEHFQESAFRLELLPEYAVGSDGGDFQRWLDGAAEPTWERKNAWLDVLRADMMAGRLNCRVKVMSPNPTLYERYASQWGYAINVGAGEDIYILDTATTPLPTALDGLRDFWLIDDRTIIVMHYDEHGRFEGGEIAPDAELPRYRAARDAALAVSLNFSRWWEIHPHLHRQRRAA